jgi:hypothetical protein
MKLKDLNIGDRFIYGKCSYPMEVCGKGSHWSLITCYHIERGFWFDKSINLEVIQVCKPAQFKGFSN